MNDDSVATFYLDVTYLRAKASSSSLKLSQSDGYKAILLFGKRKFDITVLDKQMKSVWTLDVPLKNKPYYFKETKYEVKDFVQTEEYGLDLSKSDRTENYSVSFYFDGFSAQITVGVIDANKAKTDEEQTSYFTLVAIGSLTK